METSKDEFVRGGGGTPPNAGLAPDVLPAVRSFSEGNDLQIGVSTLSAFPQANTKKDTSHWYVLRCTYGREKKAYEFFLKKGIEAYYPTITTKRESDKKNQYIEESRLPNILFAFATFEELKVFVYDNHHDETKFLRFYYNQYHDGTKEPLIVPPWQMENLMKICNSEADDKHLEPFVVEKFKSGQLVKVTEGPFKDVVGTVHRYKGQQRVGIVIEGLLTITTAYISREKLVPVLIESK